MRGLTNYKTILSRLADPALSVADVQAVGGNRLPRFGHCYLYRPARNRLVFATSAGESGLAIVVCSAIRVHGRVRDENARAQCRIRLSRSGRPTRAGANRHVKDGYIRAPLDPNFGGCGRTLTRRRGALRVHDRSPRRNSPGPTAAMTWRPNATFISRSSPCLSAAPHHPDVFRGATPLIARCPNFAATRARRRAARPAGVCPPRYRGRATSDEIISPTVFDNRPCGASARNDVREPPEGM